MRNNKVNSETKTGQILNIGGIKNDKQFRFKCNG